MLVKGSNSKGIFLKFDLEKYKTVAQLGPNIELNLKEKLKYILIYIVILIFIIFYYPLTYTWIIAGLIGYLLVHEFIHWVAHLILTGEIAKFGLCIIGPYVYIDGYTPRNIALKRAAAPAIVIGITLLIAALLIPTYLVWIIGLFLMNVAGAWSDIVYCLALLRFPKEAIAGDEDKRNIVKMPIGQ
ncbi:Putative zincin peptidase [uncultured archaeon]|nr:Putative zincin peptidase [uncultured archaeon]